MPHDGSAEPKTDTSSNVNIEKTLPAEYRWVRRVIHEIEDLLCERGISSEDIGSVAIILAEAMNNVVEHAYHDVEDGEIKLVMRQRGQSLILEITDRGKPMPKGRAPMGNHPMSEFDANDAMPEGGYGWFLIRELVRDLVYDRKEDQNLLFFRYRLES